MAVSNINFANIRETGKNPVVEKFDCGTVVPCACVVLRNVSLATTSLFGAAKFVCKNCKGDTAPQKNKNKKRVLCRELGRGAMDRRGARLLSEATGWPSNGDGKHVKQLQWRWHSIQFFFSFLMRLYRALRGCSCGSHGFLEDRMMDIITGRAPPLARAESHRSKGSRELARPGPSLLETRGLRRHRC